MTVLIRRPPAIAIKSGHIFKYTSNPVRSAFSVPHIIRNGCQTTRSRTFFTQSIDHQNQLEQPLSFPTSGYTTIAPDDLVEEEELPDYQPERFYPAHIGEVLHDRYQLCAKLGFGSSSTTWLARDLSARQYVALKIGVHSSVDHRELPVYKHLSRLLNVSSNAGPQRANIRKLLDSFTVTGPHGQHAVQVLEPAQMSLRDMRFVFRRDGFEEHFVRGAIIELLKALDFLHSQGEIVHTDVHSGNMLLGLYDNEILRRLEDKEVSSPVTRKIYPDRTIYLSRLMLPKEGPMLLSDFGEARIGPGPHAGDIMPLEYRAPETLLYIGWSYPVDIWSVGLTAWDMLGSKRLFTARDEDGDLYDAAHLAQVIAALGPPPPEFLARNPERRADFWNDQNEWLGLAPIPHDRTIESLESKLDDNSGFLRFLRFLRKTLTWEPEKRATAKELLEDPWLMGR